MQTNQREIFASATVARHLIRGAVGFSLLAAAFVLAAGGEPLGLSLVVPAAGALRGCPTCWAVGLAQTLSAGRLERSCGADSGARFGAPCRVQTKRFASRT
jgi:hypothetical protein